GATGTTQVAGPILGKQTPKKRCHKMRITWNNCSSTAEEGDDGRWPLAGLLCRSQQQKKQSNSCSVSMAANERRGHRSRRRWQRVGVAPLLQKNMLVTPKEEVRSCHWC
ncbi:hypothetical protein GW17_00044514, partial [Ensete ventricosum]